MEEKMDAVSKAFSNIYTGVFSIHLKDDTYEPVKMTDSIAKLLTGISSAQEAISYAIQNTVVSDDVQEMKEFVDLTTLSDRIGFDKYVIKEYRGKISGWVRGSFIEAARDENGRLIQVLYTYQIIEKEKRQELEQQELLEKTLAEATLDSEIIDSISRIYWLIYRMDLVKDTYEEISAGQEMHRLTGKHGKTEEVFQEARENIVAPEYQEMMKEFLDTSTLAQRLQDSDSIAMEYHAANGSWHLARFIVKKRNRDGVVTNVLYVVRIIDQEKQKENEYKQKIVEAAEEAYRANLAKTDFLRRMSHDIRTPINGILGMVAIADKYPEDVLKLKECRGKVKQAAEFLLDLVNNVLDMNKLESGSVILEHEPFDLHQILRQTNAITEMNGANKGITISFKNEGIEHSHLIGSYVHLQQILQNIAENAVKYTDKGGIVCLSCNEIMSENGRAVYRFICSDTGRGMSEEFLVHAFEPFAQECNDARTSYMGTGLGLAIVKQLVEMMDGTIDVDSKIGAGTTFYVTISFEIDATYREAADIDDIYEDSFLSGLNILLVEDNELNMEIAKFLLEEAGVHVVTAENGKEAVDIFAASKKDTFDFILMDVMMPVMDGISAAKAIRAMHREDAWKVPIIAMTANAFADDRQKTKEAGMNAHLSKPLNEKSLLKMMKKYVVPKSN